MRPTLVFFIGPTNAGKTTLLNAIREQNSPWAEFIEVGKLLRAKYLEPSSPYYDADFFKGKAAPTHTEGEAYQLMADGIRVAENNHKKAVFIDGQPRSLKQLASIMADYADYRKKVYHLFCPRAQREERARARDTDPAKLSLSLARMDGDVLDVYEIDHLLKRHGVTSEIVDTGHEWFDAQHAAAQLIYRLAGYAGQ